MSSPLLQSPAARRGETADADGSRTERAVLRCSSARQRLESAVFNAVSLGQWEVAGALFAELAGGHAGSGGHSEGRENARELLKLIIMESSNFLG